jgi:hypothetical protein
MCRNDHCLGYIITSGSFSVYILDHWTWSWHVVPLFWCA